jgi:hypothetical protein
VLIGTLPMKHLYVQFQSVTLYSRRGSALALKHKSSQLRISRPVAYDVAGRLRDRLWDMQKDAAGTTPAGFVLAILQKVMPSIYAATAPVLREAR